MPPANIAQRITWRPLAPTDWPTATPRPATTRDDPFDSTLEQTIEELHREVWHLGASRVVIALDVAERALRRDGRPYADSKVGKPDVVLYMERDRKPALTLPCATFRDWRANLRAIVKTLNGLRMMQRYGVVQNDQQYRGFAAIPAEAQSATGPLPPRASAEAVVRAVHGTSLADHAVTRYVDDILKSRDVARDFVRSALRRAHPQHGGTDNDFALVTRAKAGLEALYGGTL